MSNQPDQPDQPTQASPVPSEKLVLPAPPGQESDGQTYTDLTRPVPRLHQEASSVPGGLFFSRIRSFWRQGPARALGLAMAVVLAASIVLVALGASTLLHSTSSHPSQTPSTGRVATSAPALTVQIISISDHVENGTMVPVKIQTSQPDLSVRLQATYQVPPFSSTTGPKTTDGAGRATIDWPVNVSSFEGNTQSTVTVVATNQNGQQVMSNPVTVTIANPHHKGNNHDNHHDNND